jgi:hypothetical protein
MLRTHKPAWRTPLRASLRRPRSAFGWTVAFVAISAVVLLPWIAYLAVSLPSSVTVRHWPLVWGGLDSAIAAGLIATAWLAIRHDRRLAFLGPSTATLLITDGWFDVCTAPAGRPLMASIADMCVELGEAVACIVLAVAVWRDERSGESR